MYIKSLIAATLLIMSAGITQAFTNNTQFGGIVAEYMEAIGQHDVKRVQELLKTNIPKDARQLDHLLFFAQSFAEQSRLDVDSWALASKDAVATAISTTVILAGAAITVLGITRWHKYKTDLNVEEGQQSTYSDANWLSTTVENCYGKVVNKINIATNQISFTEKLLYEFNKLKDLYSTTTSSLDGFLESYLPESSIKGHHVETGVGVGAIFLGGILSFASNKIERIKRHKQAQAIYTLLLDGFGKTISFDQA